MKKLIILIALSLYCASVHAQNTLAGNLTVQQTVKLTGSITPSTIMTDVNNYAPTGFSTASTVRLSSDNLRTVTGLAGGAAGRTVTLMNIGEFAITLATESTSSAAGNRFAIGSADFTLAKGSAITLWYDGTSSRWRATSNTVVDGAAVDQVARDAAAAAQATANSKQDALANAGTLAKVTEAAGLPLWDGGAWPGGGGGTGTVTSVSVTTANGVSGTVANPTTAPAIALALGAITPTSVAATGTVTGSNLSGTNTGDQTSVAGNAGTATALQTARTINGVSFDGTANITVPAAAGTLTGSTLASGVTGSSLTSAAGGTFGTAAFTNSTAYDPAGAAAAITLSGLGGVPTTRTVNGHSLSSSVTVTASDVGLGSVENTALSTWTGSSNLATVGTITSGTWTGSVISDSYISSASAWNAKVSFPGFGTTAGTAAEGNDARLSDARTPTAHNQAWSTITSTPTTLSGYGIADAQPLDADLTAFAGLSTTGIVARTGTGTAATRTITGTANQITVTNGDGVAGNPTLALPQSIAPSSTPTFAKLSVNGSLDPSARVVIGSTSATEAVLRLDHSSSSTGILTEEGQNGIRLKNTDSTVGNWSFLSFYNSDGYVASTIGAQYVSKTGLGAASICLWTRGGPASGGFVLNSIGTIRLAAYGAGTLVTDSSGNVTASSDASLKTITGTFTRGLADVLKLTPRTYHWNEKSGMDTGDENVGFIAQEVLESIPEAVGQYRTSEVEVDGKKIKKREKAELLTLSDRPLIAALVNAVKELKAENDELEARIAKLEAKK